MTDMYLNPEDYQVEIAANLSEFAADESRTWAERKWAFHRLLRMASDPNAPYPTTEQVKEHTILFREENP